MKHKESLLTRFKNLFIGRAHSLQDKNVFQHLSLIAFFAWVGLGADGLSSSCYGPSEAFLALNTHTYLSIFVALGTVLTIFVIAASYSQIVELFPSGGGGYLVASKLLSPKVGMVSGCALLIDYVLTITVSIASGADAVFSLLPLHWQPYKMAFAILIIFLMMLLNMRGIKESILPLVPIFLTFLATHVFIIIYGIATHVPRLPAVAQATHADLSSSISSIGFFGVMFMVLRAYSMGAGTYTGIEAISNGLPALREPRVQTAKHTMRYMAFSLAFMVMGLMLSYLLYNVTPQAGKTLNGILFEKATMGWYPKGAYLFVFIALVSEACLLFVAAQAGFLDGPRVLANMAVDRWFPTRFATLSDRLVIQNGILIMSGLAAAIMIFTHGSVRLLIVFYSINVFITFALSQLGMVRHWWGARATVRDWLKKFLINGFGLSLTLFILLSMVTVKFFEGGWVTLLITGVLVSIALVIKRHYRGTAVLLGRLDTLVAATEGSESLALPGAPVCAPDNLLCVPNGKTAVLLVSGFNGIGLHTLFGVVRLFEGFKNFVFVQVGVVDAGNFKGAQEVDGVKQHMSEDLNRYVRFMKKQGFYAEGVAILGVDVVYEVAQAAPSIMERFPNAVFFGGQLIFPDETLMLRFLHNHTVFMLQKKLYREGIPFVILPIRV
ncbi:MAG: APC family permease [Candidatus Omnitrophota bacterium]